jgi:hypothetical protein
MISRAAALISFTAIAVAQPGGLTVPRIGMVRGEDGAVRAVLGVAAGFQLGGRAAAAGAISAAFSGTAGVVKTADELLIVDEQGNVGARHAAPPGPVLAAFRADGSIARLHFAAIDETVVALGETTSVVRRDGGYFWLDGDGDGLRLDGAAEPMAMLAGDRLVHHVEGGLAVRRRDRPELRIALDDEPRRIEPMGRGWIHVIAGGRSLALKIDGDRAAVHELPRR